MNSRVTLTLASLLAAITLNLIVTQLLKQEEELEQLRIKLQKLEMEPVLEETLEPEPEIVEVQ
jgi:hypothetical protein